MAITNPRKKFNFRVSILPAPEIPVFSVQQMSIGESAIEPVEHGFGNTILKTAGLIKPGNLTMERIMSASSADISAAIWAWHWAAQNPALQIGGDPVDYKRVIKVEELGDGFGSPIVLSTWFAVGAWPSTINGREFDRTASENLIDSIEFSVDYITQDYQPDSIFIPGNAGL